jgi:hypothetical protein
MYRKAFIDALLARNLLTVTMIDQVKRQRRLRFRVQSLTLLCFGI